MHDVEAKNRPTRSTLKSFNAWLAVDYPAYLPSNRQVKSCLALCSAKFDRMGKNDNILLYNINIFVSYGSLALAFCLLQIRHRDENAVRPHLFEWIIAFISINYRSREREREMTVVCTCLLRLRVSLYKQLTLTLLQKQRFYHLVAGEYNVAI